MRIGLPEIQQIEGFHQPIAAAFRKLVSAIQTGWNRQHQGDGSHGDVVASSLTSPVVRSQGRLIGSRIWDVNTPAEADTQPLTPGRPFVLGTGGAFFDVLRVRTSSTAGAPIVHGLSAIGREEGERIIIYNDGNWDLTLS